METVKKIFKFDFTPTIILYICFMVLTGLLVYVDVQPIGPGGSLVGLGTINEYVFSHIGKSVFWYNLTQLLGKIAILYMIGFAVYGLVQWVERQKIRRVDKDLIALAILYILIALHYVVFQLFIINFRPLLVINKMEASYPSSHTMLLICVMVSAILQFHYRIKKKALRIVAEIFSGAVMVVTVVGRLLSGVHWFTDILGAILLSAALSTFYYALAKRMRAYQASQPVKVKTKKKKAKRNK
ncbi:MAG: phosphatase PAP2 family protein [Lachnospiraceae bacterium]|nr:phosphatase PAP2 family protein [Lachnospiraceae bacterium]MDD6192219.1 phosphatase PAP2 family protein [Lachnospiraceae bacterium]MDY4792795.1 phosphatase PAP2 family protein [Pararoseburia sp.]